jgi:hypothetical protein
MWFHEKFKSMDYNKIAYTFSDRGEEEKLSLKFSNF